MNRKAVTLVVLVFLLGVAVGALGYYAASKQGLAAAPRNGHTRAELVDRLTGELGLNAAQREQLTAILEETKRNFDAVYEQIRPQKEGVRQQGRQKIRAILTPEQLPRFEEFLRRIDEERKQRGNR